MKKISILFLTLFLFSCSKNEELFSVKSSETPSSGLTSLLGGFPAIGIANREYAKPGPYSVSTNAVRGDCQFIMGVVYGFAAQAGIIAPTLCNPTFPAGFNHPVATEVWYPSNIQSLDKLPVVNLVGGIISNQGNYDVYARLWASYGFIVVNTNDFINLTPLMHVIGAIEVSKLNKDPQSPLFGKADLSKMIAVGHSAGAGAAITLSSFPPAALRIIDPEITLVATLPIQPSILTTTTLFVGTPSLILAAEIDEIVLKESALIHYRVNSSRQPAWFATARSASHFSPNRAIERNEYAGISVAWLLYQGKNDRAASEYFLGPNYRLAQDEQFTLTQTIFTPIPSLYQVQRNDNASRLPSLTGTTTITPTVPTRPVIPSLF